MSINFVSYVTGNSRASKFVLIIYGGRLIYDKENKNDGGEEKVFKFS